MATRLAGNLRGSDKGLLGLRAIPQITFQISDGAGFNEVRIDVGGAEFHRSTQIGVHRALTIGCDEHIAARGGGAIFCRWRGIGDTACADVVGE